MENAREEEGKHVFLQIFTSNEKMMSYAAERQPWCYITGKTCKYLGINQHIIMRALPALYLSSSWSVP